MGLAQPIDGLVNLLKWPVAVGCVALTPGAAIGFFDVGRTVVQDPTPYTLFGAGFGGYLVLWWLFFRRPLMGSMFSTVEHELTHGLFALLTFHRIEGLRATWRSGGEIAYSGGPGNWLITIAPYWFPTLCMPFVLVLLLGPTAHLGVISVAMGVVLSYQLTSTYIETHRGQTDLQKVGFVFAWMVLPFLNFVAISFVVLSAGVGADAALAWFAELSTWSREAYSGLTEWVGAASETLSD
jgi:hypothetical protein